MAEGLEIYGFEEFEKMMQDAVKSYPAMKERELVRLGHIYLRFVKSMCPVDTGRLRGSIFVGTPEKDSVMVGTNVKYAKFVEDGHMQHQRFVPGYWRDKGGFQYVAYPDSGVYTTYDDFVVYSGGGMMLHERWVEGKHPFQNAMYAAKAEMVAEIESFMAQIKKELEG